MMDETTEPILVVIAHPIAGNPTQFATERALRSMKLEWRVLSFDVQSEDVAAALDGFAVTGIAGVLIDPSLQAAASDWYRSKTETDSGPIDCLFRDPGKHDGRNEFSGVHQQRAWLDEQIAGLNLDADQTDQRLWYGDSLQPTLVDVNQFAALPAELPANPEALKHAKLIALTARQGGPLELEEQEWPPNDGSTLVIDLTSGDIRGGNDNRQRPDMKKIEDLGYRVITVCDRQIGTLQRCLQRWTGSDPSAEVIRDAIEEYLGV